MCKCRCHKHKSRARARGLGIKSAENKVDRSLGRIAGYWRRKID